MATDHRGLRRGSQECRVGGGGRCALSHRLIAELALVIVLLALPVAAQARGVARIQQPARPPASAIQANSGLPGLLVIEFSSSFPVRPAKIFLTMDGAFIVGGTHLKSGHIHWQTWNASTASGRGKMSINNGIPNIAQGTYYGHGATVYAFRVRHGHFTRLRVRYHLRGRVRTERYHLSGARNNVFTAQICVSRSCLAAESRQVRTACRYRAAGLPGPGPQCSASMLGPHLAEAVSALALALDAGAPPVNVTLDRHRHRESRDASCPGRL